MNFGSLELASVDDEIVDGFKNEERDAVDAVSDGGAERNVDVSRSAIKLMEEVTRRILPPFVRHVDVQVDAVIGQWSNDSANDGKHDNITHCVEH